MGLTDRLAKASDKFYDRMRSDAADSVADAEPTGSIDDLKGRKYCVLVSYRKNGQPVPSPLWFGVWHGKLYFHSGGYKLTRIERNPQVRVAPSNFRGRPLGPPLLGSARLLVETAETEEAEAAIQANYGIERRAYYRLSRQRDLGRYIEVTPA